jgi:dihydrofolate reductase
MDMIAAIDRNWGIGRDGGLLVHIPEDMRHFRHTTEGAAVILGRATLRTFPGGRPLKGRENIVLSRDPALAVPGARVCHNLDEALRAARDCEAAGRRVFVIGGADVYAQLAPYCAGAVLTELDAVFPADRFFPDLLAAGWRRGRTLGEGCHEGLSFAFVRYENPSPLSF